MTALVLITGATGGVGAQVVRLVAGAGYAPVIGHRPARAAEAAALAAHHGGVPVVLDLADHASIERAVTSVAADGRPLAGVVLAASPPPVLAPFGRIAPEDHALFWAANVVGPQRLLAGLVRACLRPRRAGAVVAVLTSAMGGVPGESGEGWRPAATGMGAYTVSKFGLAGVMALLAAEHPWLRVRTISPGFTETPMLRVFDERYLDQVRARGPLATPGEVAAEVVALLALPEAAGPVSLPVEPLP